MYNNVFNFMNEKELIYKISVRFSSTQEAIISLVDKITKNLDSGDIVNGFFLGKKAFDTVPHNILYKNVCI